MKQTLLCIDDSPSQLQLYKEQMDSLFTIHTAQSYEECLAILSTVRPDLILLDMVMPSISGLDLLAILRRSEIYREIPVIVVSSQKRADVVRQAFKLGANDYVRKPYDGEELILRAKRLVAMQPKKAREEHETQSAMVTALADLASTRDNETGKHLFRIEKYMELLVKRVWTDSGFDSEKDSIDPVDLPPISILHDIGKVGIPDNILQKPGPLSVEEFRIMKTHTTIGADTIGNIRKAHPNLTFLTMAQEIARSHHECWNGSGYPDGLAGKAIPLSARMLTLIDVFDALTNKRVYKDAYSFSQALGIMEEQRGTKYDPRIFDLFIQCVPDFEPIYQAYGDR